MTEAVPSFLPAIIATMALSLLPFLVVMGTAFTKITIVLTLVRNAIGVQQAPSGMLINAIALTLTAFILMPLGDDILRQIAAQNITSGSWDNIAKIYDIISSTFSKYLLRFSNERELTFFMEAAKKLWPAPLHGQITRDNIFILLSSHVTSELTRAFEIAFVLFLPFVVVDLVVSNILLAMGAMMVPPMLISLPLKILLFVAADGWAVLLHNLILSYT
ncbi:type III secretion protein R [Bradyrhizobium sp. USDA 4524]|uniref:type III secretion system export apparatus subunit SctR n=1 Tax=unclassified Bradyrhizobium TaxID=2631580 RepID=UPI00209EE566|nr:MULTISPECIES: type III secretion system export apparatus subunit SctR [unclassified Bradyrhizobium]MCP1846088.1 type III secretion protein R [Bradyrhizobium sp. USDA 4538]MCP1907278.1 type III secretion protein R [Bradyrhizobium sp. USDA 4537]MCP1985753.1 type III secretion protein R [Bradyrhizobium sp. USDA 4539]